MSITNHKFSVIIFNAYKFNRSNNIHAINYIVDNFVYIRAIVVGVLSYSTEGLTRYLNKNNQIDIRAMGMLVISKGVTPEMARATIKSIIVLGVFKASKEFKEALADRIM